MMEKKPVSTTEHHPAPEAPLRGEPFSAEHLREFAPQLARSQKAERRRGDRQLADRFEDNCQFIGTAYRAIAARGRKGEPIGADAEWLVDNYYVVEEQLREIREDLPRSFYRELPKLKGGLWDGRPRIYELAHELIVHTDSGLDEELIVGFVTAYQEVTPLTSGEIWAMPIMLRLVLVENLRRICSHMLTTSTYRQRALELLDDLEAGKTVVDLPETHGCSTVVLELIEILRGPAASRYSFGVNELSERLGQPQHMLDDCVHVEQQRLAANQVSIGNVITSMRLLSALDWTLFFERVSLVEQRLRQDPAGVYARMDFASRDMYRHEIESLAKRGGHEELHVAAKALKFALEAQTKGSADPRTKHIGYYLIDGGRRELERQLNYRPKLRERIVRGVKRWPSLFYLTGIGGLTVLGVWFLVWGLMQYGVSLAVAALLGVVAAIPISELAVTLHNALVTTLLRPRLLPKLEFTESIPARCRTLVVMPTMLTSDGGVRALVERLEIHYLANPEPGLSFALLSDFVDAPEEHMPEDEPLLSAARAAIAELNRRHAEDAEPKFHLLHRRRLWNAEEKLWMGWERKRGKLQELNRLLRDKPTPGFIEADDAATLLRGVRYVITLDSDTRLPHAAARRLVGALSHPLNRASFGAERRIVTNGYGILQPRVSVSLASANRSIFSRIYANSAGLDPYCTAVSDVYQDLFGEGSFTGKGIYEVDAFESATDGVFPENHILSHDLIEGCYARVGLLTDVELFDEFPERLEAEVGRQRRWIRGDWQLLPWLGRRAPTEGGGSSNPLSVLSRWKIFDNLRRSLVPLTLLLFLILGWYTAPHAAGLISTVAAVVVAAPLLAFGLSTLVSWRPGDDWRQSVEQLFSALVPTVIQRGLALAFLPLRAQYSTDAIGRTLYRLCVSRRHLLEWETADAAARRLKRAAGSHFLSMGWILLLAIGVAVFLPAGARWAAIPILACWIISPALADLINRPIRTAQPFLSSSEQKALRRIARQTWSFFETFVGPEDNWLPPDNFQEFPQPKIAHRISPTNEGLFIISALAARDFGYISGTNLVSLLEQNLNMWAKLTRYRGHSLNWYDTTTLRPLSPRYVSTADSGNLAAGLLTAQQGLSDVIEQPLFGPFIAEGVSDSVGMIEEALGRLQPRGARFVNPALDAFEKGLSAVRSAAKPQADDFFGWCRMNEQLKVPSERLTRLLAELQSSLGLKAGELTRKVGSLLAHIDGLHADAQEFAPWTRSIDAVANWSGAAGNALVAALGKPLSLNQLSSLPEELVPRIAELRKALESGGTPDDEVQKRRTSLDAFIADVDAGAKQARAYRDRYQHLGKRYESMAMEMDFTLLYNAQRRLFSVGYNLEDGRPDRSHYDLLASEARIASLISIAKGDADHRHWFQLGRALTRTSSGDKGLLSWGGTMFEFLMPVLFTRDFAGSLLDQSCRAAVQRQIAYGQQRKVPWGISESAYSAQGANSDYQYQSFGVPGLGLKQGLGKDLVISPYSTALAAMIDPQAAVANFHTLAVEGGEGPWGLYEAIDYTPERVPEGERRVVVLCYMAHHQGMVMAALANCLLDNRMQRRFQRQPLARAIDLLLQERVPVSVLQFQPQDDGAAAPPVLPITAGPVSRQISTPHTAVPRAHLLSNGKYSVMVTNSGAGYSRFENTAVTRWRPDATRDDCGQFLYLRDVTTGRVWSAGHQPTRAPADNYEVTYSVDKAEFRRRDGDLETHLEIALSPEQNVEVRQVTLTNHGKAPVTIEVTSYGEVVLSSAAADAAHPAFSKLFVETEYLPDCHALLASRRPRDASSPPAWAMHVVAVPASATESSQVTCETDRARFIGRGRSLAAPAAMDANTTLTGTTGAVLDPIFSLRGRITVAPDESTHLAFSTAFAESREQAVQLADQYRDPRVVQRTFEMAWAHSQVELRHLHVSGASVQLYQRLASAVLFPDASLRAPFEVLKSNRLGQRSLWRYGISGDDPIVLVRVTESAHRALVREVLMAHEFWNTHGLKVDVVIVNEHPAGYFDEFQDQLQALIQSTTRMPMHKSGGVYLLRAAQLTPEDIVLLQAVSSINLHGNAGGLSRQMDASPPAARSRAPDLRLIASAVAPTNSIISSEPEPALEFANGVGGFNGDGDYVIRLHVGQSTPLPWSNVIANDRFGFLVTESGGGYTWSGNSRENKLTSWSNDPVADLPSEILYLRDEETGEVWTPTLLPRRDNADYWVCHGRGWSRFVHSAQGIRAELTMSIAPNACAKFACLKLRNDSQKARMLSAIYYVEWVLGVTRQQTQMHVYTEQDSESKALLAHNCYHEDFPDQVAYLHVLGGADTVTGDRTEFIGRNCSESIPAALRRTQLSGTTGTGLDPAGAVQKQVTLPPGQEAELIFTLGWGEHREAAIKLLAEYQMPEQVRAAVGQTTDFWRQTSTAITVKTPNRALDTLVNHWLLYQTLSCRVWGRSAFYQAGGAYGYRDQLQDSMALVYSLPGESRRIILQAASRQFEAGDVQHWWHPPTGRGVRTRFADDYLWLPLVTGHYVTTTGDSSILNEVTSYLHSLALEPHEEERYELPEISSVKEDLYHHCLRAIDHALRFGVHGLPLIGTGDWNDGLNKVGNEGRGESVWMGWFLRVVLQQFIPLVEGHGDAERANVYRREADRLLQAVEREAWDGKWYRRAYFDDGSPIGSCKSEECQIDSLAQSWAVIAGADPQRASQAMRSVEEHLIRTNDRLALLLEPPFDKSNPSPGYIQGYPPGIRENGGQYTHAATWVVQALAAQGRGTQAVKLFDLLNPILSSASESAVDRYRVEPFVVAADVYSNPQHVGRGGWTWYTGSAAWMYRVAVESILGLRLRGDRLTLAPCIPKEWDGYEMAIRRGRTIWRLRLSNEQHVDPKNVEVLIDGIAMSAEGIQLVDDGREHIVEASLRSIAALEPTPVDADATNLVERRPRRAVPK